MKTLQVTLVLALTLLTSCATSPKVQDSASGRVVVRFVVTETGDVEDVSVESSTNAAYNQPAINAVKKWKFRPGIKNGKPVRIAMKQSIVFKWADDQEPVPSAQPEGTETDHPQEPGLVHAPRG